MRLLTDLADAARGSGLEVVELPGWRTRGHGPMAGVKAVLCHHTAGPATGDTPSLRMVAYTGRPDLPAPLCHLYLSRAGRVYVVAAGLAYHAGVVHVPATQDNGHAIGIEAEATGIDEWPAWQWNAYARLCAALVRHYGLSPHRVLMHKEVAKPAGRKIDPNFDAVQFRAAVSAVLTTPAPAPPATVRVIGDVMYLRCESVKGGPVWTGWLSGGLLVGPLSPGELESAEAVMKQTGQVVQWVERATWERLEAAAGKALA